MPRPAQIAPPIQIRGCRVHNLRSIDVDIRRGELTVLCGLSGSGKTSLAIDTLYAEGQRCYIESFSAYTRQFLDRLDKPDCRSIRGIPPAIAVTRAAATKNNRSTVATATETAEHLRLLFAKAATLVCHLCGEPVVALSPDVAAAQLSADDTFSRAIVAFEVHLPDRAGGGEILHALQRDGYVRLILGGTTERLDDDDRQRLAAKIGKKGRDILVVVDRLSSGDEVGRWTDSLETAMDEGVGRAVVLVDGHSGDDKTVTVDGRDFSRRIVSDSRRCDRCDVDFPDPVPRLFNFNDPAGACETCEGFGDVMTPDMARVVPDESLSIRDGAIAPWNTPSYKHELKELLAIARHHDLPVDVPFAQLTVAQRRVIQRGDAKRKFGGLDGFFAWLDKKKYKLSVRVFAARYRSYQPCPACGGARLRPEVLAYKIAGRSIAQMLAAPADQLAAVLDQFEGGAEAREVQIAAEPIAQIRDRLAYLQRVGLGYLTLDRPLRTLSGGETQRIALTAALSSTLVGMLYVLDEPTAGLHPADVTPLIGCIKNLRDRGNTVVAVEHNDAVIAAADRVIEFGPGAGAAGGTVTFDGPPGRMKSESSLTGPFLGDDLAEHLPPAPARPSSPRLKLTGARGRNLLNVDVEFPIGAMSVLTGRSGSGKSTLIHDTLHPAVAAAIDPSAGTTALPFKKVSGTDSLAACELIDQSPISRSSRSCPVTYVKAMDGIRTLFAATVDARIRNYGPGHFSFNSADGQCQQCEGAGVETVDMQFLADVTMRCSSCRGQRYPRRSPAGAVPRPDDCRGAGDDDGPGREIFPRVGQDSKSVGPAGRRRAGLRAAGPARHDAVLGRGPTAQTGGLPGPIPPPADAVFDRRTDHRIALRRRAAAAGLFRCVVGRRAHVDRRGAPPDGDARGGPFDRPGTGGRPRGRASRRRGHPGGGRRRRGRDRRSVAAVLAGAAVRGGGGRSDIGNLYRFDVS